jgi:hypothetical protein
MELTPSTIDMRTLLLEVYEARRSHFFTSLRAKRAKELLKALADCRFWLPRAEALSAFGSAVESQLFDSDGDDDSGEFSGSEACEQMFAAHLPETQTLDGVLHVVVRPLLEYSTSTTRALGLEGHLAFCTPKELTALDAELLLREEYLGGDPVITGISAREARVLAAYHAGAALALVNVLRHLETALHYMESARANDFGRFSPTRAWVQTRHDDGIEELLVELERTVKLPLVPKPARWFGTDADRVNPLKALPEGFADMMLTLTA